MSITPAILVISKKVKAMRLIKRIKSNEKGLALIEIIIALGILGAITAAVVALASRTIATNNLNSTIKNIVEISIAMKTVFKGNYTNSTGKSLGDILESFGAVTTEQMENPIGDDFEWKSVAVRSESNRAGVLLVPNLRVEHCLALVQQLWDAAEYLKAHKDKDFDKDIAISKDDADIAKGFLKTIDGDQQYTVADAITACGADDGINVFVGTR